MRELEEATIQTQMTYCDHALELKAKLGLLVRSPVGIANEPRVGILLHSQLLVSFAVLQTALVAEINTGLM